MRPAFAFLVLLLVLAAAVPPAVAESDCQLKRVARLDMTFGRDGRVRVPMTIAGQTFPMLVDTGGVLSMLTPPSVEALGLSQKAVPLVQIRQYGGLTVDHYVTADNVELGTMKGARFDFLVMPEGGYSSDIGGLLGPDILMKFDADFDFANRALSLFEQDHCEGRVVYWTRDPYGVIDIKLNEVGQISVPVMLDGKEITALIDTGAARSVASLETIEDLFDLNTTSLNMQPLFGPHPARRTYRYPFRTLSFQSVTVNNPNLLLIPDSQSKQPPGAPKMLLGMNVLRQLHLYIAYGERRLYVTPANATPAPTPPASNPP